MRERRREKGVITAFFSLVLVLVIAMLLCMAESARLTACGRCADSILRLGTKSLLGSYDLPLYENYHVFGRSAGGEDGVEVLSEELSWYIQQNLSGNSWLDMQPEAVRVTGMMPLTHEGGAMFYAQAIQYEKYREVEEFADWLLLAAAEAERAERMGELLQRTLQVQEGAAKAEETMSELLGCLDGFVVEEGNVVRNVFGKIKTRSGFAKKLVPGGAGEWILPGNAELYAAQRGNYVDTAGVYARAESYKRNAEGLEEGLRALWLQYEDLEPEDISGREIMEKQMAEMQQSLDSCRNALQREVTNFWAELGSTRLQTERALELLARLETEKEGARAGLLAHREELFGYEGKVPDTVYEELVKQNEELLVHFSEDNAVGIIKDIRGMREALRHNVQILTAAQEGEPRNSFAQPPELAVAGVGEAHAKLTGLRLRELVLDYAAVKIPEKSGSYTKLIRQFFKYGVLMLVVDEPDELSRGCLGTEPLPSRLCAGEKRDGTFSFKKLFEGGGEEAFSIRCGDIGSFVKKEARALAEEFLYLSYLKRHFAVYTDGLQSDPSEPGEALEGLIYQLEYIIAGQDSDVGNLAEIAEKIFLIRFAMNLAVIFASGECRAQIKSAAVAAVGFTGIGALVVLAELLLSMLWAAECALTEAAGLFMGGEVAFLPAAASLPIGFRELGVVSKELWQQKAEKYTQKEAGGILKTYCEYLDLFLALKDRQLRTMRTMDIVQQVIRLKYDEAFLMQNCICAVETEMEVVIPYRFLPAAGIRFGEGIRQHKKYGISY